MREETNLGPSSWRPQPNGNPLRGWSTPSSRPPSGSPPRRTRCPVRRTRNRPRSWAFVFCPPSGLLTGLKALSHGEALLAEPGTQSHTSTGQSNSNSPQALGRSQHWNHWRDSLKTQPWNLAHRRLGSAFAQTKNLVWSCLGQEAGGA